VLKIKELRFSGIGRFVEEQVIDFSDLGKLVQVDGLNHNTNGSSGSGKSTVFNALDYLLGLNDLPNTVLQSRLTKDGISVLGAFDMDGKSVAIARNKGRLSIRIGDETTEGNNKLAEEKLDQILAMPRHLFRPMLHKRQREGGFFLQMTPKETHEFLADCLGLSEMATKLSIIDGKINSLEELRIRQGYEMSSHESSLAATREALSTVLADPPTKRIDRDSINALRERANEAMLKLKSTKDRHLMEEASLEAEKPKLHTEKYNRAVYNELQSELNEATKIQKDLEQSEEYKRQVAERALSVYQEEVRRLTRIIDKSEHLQKESVDIAFQVKSIRDCRCPTCEQPWMDDKSHKTEADLLEKLKVHRDALLESDKAKVGLESFQKKVEDILPYTKVLVTDQIKSLESKRKELMEKLEVESRKERDFDNMAFILYKNAMDDFSARQKTLRDRHTGEQEIAAGQVAVSRMALDSAVESIRFYEDAMEKYDSMLSSMRDQEKSSQKKIEDLKIAQEGLIGDLMLAEESRKAIKSYTSCSFDDALADIGDMATRTISNIPNMSNATIQLEGVRETKEGKIKEEVNAIISVDGEIGIPIKSLSGGERSAVDLSIDLAVVDLIEQKTGKGIDIFILDEPFTGLDTVSIEMTLEMLKNSNLSKRVILVEHNPVVKEMLEDKITVVRNGHTSRIER
jgi:Putative exonuclease SbcCD, C subunit